MARAEGCESGAHCPDLPLSAAQLRWWVAQQLHPELPSTVALYLDLTGRLDRATLQACGTRAARELQSPLLRFRLVDGLPGNTSIRRRSARCLSTT